MEKALVAKLALWLGDKSDDNIFLNFAIPGLPVSKESFDIDFLMNPGVDRTNSASDFAFLTNYIPEYTGRYNPNGSYIWDTYDRILRFAKVENDNLTLEEKRLLRKSRRMLFRRTTNANGKKTRRPTVKYKKYKTYMYLYQQALDAYKIEELKQYSDDPDEKTDWIMNRGALQDAVDIAEANWIAEGFKNEIDEAIATIDQLTGNSPRLLWQEWGDEFEDGKYTDFRDRDFYFTSVMPDNPFDAKTVPWTKFKINRKQIRLLLEKANELGLYPDIIGSQKNDTNIRRIDMEVLRINISRSWMDPALFGSNFWSWNESDLSDGGNPPQGQMVGFPTQIILARNIKVFFKNNVPGGAKNYAETQVLRGKGRTRRLGNLSLERGKFNENTASVNSDGVQILAFVCRALPKSPNSG